MAVFIGSGEPSPEIHPFVQQTMNNLTGVLPGAMTVEEPVFQQLNQMTHITVVNKELSPEVSREVDEFIRCSPAYTGFQSPAFYHFYHSLPHFSPWYFLARDAAGKLSGVMLAVVISENSGLIPYIVSRCVVYGGPLVNGDDPEVISLLLGALNKTVGNRTLFTQLRNFRVWNPEIRDIFNTHGFVYRERLNLIVPTPSSGEILMAMSASRRRQIRKGFESGVVIRPARDEEEVMQLYAILQDLYRRKVRKPLPGKAYFISFFRQLTLQEKGIILLVFSGDKVIGGVVCPVSAPFTLSELYVCGLDQAYPQCYPSVMATWAALSHAAGVGIQSLDFMGLGRSEVPYGVRDFKLRFGGRTVNYGRFTRRNFRILYFLARSGYNLLRNLRRSDPFE